MIYDVLMFIEDGDICSIEIYEWIEYFGKKCTIINDGSHNTLKFNSLSIDNDNFNFKIEYNSKIINSLEFKTSFWRRGIFKNLFPNYFLNISENIISNRLKNHNYENKDGLNKALYYAFESISDNTLGSFFNVNVSKLECLHIASKVGIKIPQTLVTSKKNNLIDFFEKNENIICKPISNNIHFNYKQYVFAHYTEIVRKRDIDNLDEEFYPCIFQKCIEKEFELRIFYFNEKLYPSAIISQLDEEATIDYRNFNKNKLIRILPYKLPKDITNKLLEFIKKIQIDTGAIDMIVSVDGDYYFLEVNPVGQFGMTSKPCNYFIEKDIAKFLLGQS